jgi:NADH dehydrogenase
MADKCKFSDIIISNMFEPRNVLIVGGGFGGVRAALVLAQDSRFHVTLLSDDSDLRYYPTLYHTATGGPRANSSIPLGQLFIGKPVKIINDKALSLDRKTKTLTTENGQKISFDSIILGLGVVTNYFGIEGLADYSYSIKTQAEAARFKSHLHKQLIDDKKPDLNYVIVGAGPTGIELAGALPSYLRKIIKNHGLKPRNAHIDLIEAGPRLLPRMPADISRAVAKRLKKLGIKLYLGSVVQGETADGLTVSGKPIRSHTVVWTAGVTNNPFFKDNNFVMTTRGKVAVDVYLQAEDNLFVIGDNANTPFSGLAQTALVDGEFVAENLKRLASGKQMKGYDPERPITVIPAGPNWAAVEWGRAHFNGRSGWLVREAADFVGFHNLESWTKAAEQFMTEFIDQDDCPVCTAATASYVG